MLAGDAVHDLDPRRVAGDRAQQPIPPGLRILVIAGIHQRDQRKRRVAQPAKAIVPIPLAAQSLRQRRGRRRDNTAGRKMGQRFERDQRTAKRVGPLPRRLCLARPAAPEGFGLGQGLDRIDRFRRRQVRGAISQDERNDLSRRHRKFARDRAVVGVQRRRRSQHGAIRTGHRAPAAVVKTRDPREKRAVIEPQDELGPQRELSTLPANQAHDVRGLAARRHEVDHGRRAVGALDDGFQDQRAIPVTTRTAGADIGRRQQPASMVRRADQRSKARGVVKARPA